MTYGAGDCDGNNKLELTWTTAAAIIFIGLNLMGYHIWAFVHFMGPQPGSMKVEVWGQQFAWYFRYPGPDGKFGPMHVDKVDDATGNFLGLDRDRDSDSKDDIVTATLAIPVNQPVELILRSKDVTHSFFVRELRLKQDLVPGMGIPLGRKSPYREPAARLGSSPHPARRDRGLAARRSWHSG